MTTRNENNDRRDFLKHIAIATGGIALAPLISSCSHTHQHHIKSEDLRPPYKTPIEVPKRKPDLWNAIEFNKARGNAGAIPKSYLASINGPDGVKKHLGKHLPFIPEIDSSLIPKGYIALMWGDPKKGYAQHPNAPKKANYKGHWYNWIRIAKASNEGNDIISTFSDWPGDPQGHYVAFSGNDIRENSGKNTVYLVKLPSNLKQGDTIRVWAHCLYHGEYVDFITLP